MNDKDVQATIAALRDPKIASSQGQVNTELAGLLELSLRQQVALAERLNELEARLLQAEKRGIKVWLRKPAPLAYLLPPPDDVVVYRKSELT